MILLFDENPSDENPSDETPSDDNVRSDENTSDENQTRILKKLKDHWMQKRMLLQYLIQLG